MTKGLELFYKLTNKLCSQKEFNKKWSVCKDTQIIFGSMDQVGFGYQFIFTFCDTVHFTVAMDPDKGKSIISIGGCAEIILLSESERRNVIECMEKLNLALVTQMATSLEKEIDEL